MAKTLNLSWHDILFHLSCSSILNLKYSSVVIFMTMRVEYVFLECAQVDMHLACMGPTSIGALFVQESWS